MFMSCVYFHKSSQDGIISIQAASFFNVTNPWESYITLIHYSYHCIIKHGKEKYSVIFIIRNYRFFILYCFLAVNIPYISCFVS